MKFSPTPSQKEAIFSIDEDLAVTAGAGSGKTRVLAERYLNVLEQGYSFEEIAAVTFTKKAAQEMKERLSQTRPDLAGSLERAQISTIHSLCRRIIREHPREAGIDPRFKVGEEWETEALLQEVIEAEMQNRELIEGLGRPKEAAELILNLYQQIRTRGGFSFRGRETEHLVEQQDALQLAEAVDEFLALNPRTPLQKDVMEAWSHEWPLLQTSLFSGNPHLQLEALGILEDYLKKISGGLAQKTVLIKKRIEIIKEQ
ncbi:MAG: UvrD-helicase domain-containing protein, partial [Firmicutes bacterium]|nr:UvrD-helicase domain-containing protein [Bacillota bacterium]